MNSKILLRPLAFFLSTAAIAALCSATPAVLTKVRHVDSFDDVKCASNGCTAVDEKCACFIITYEDGHVICRQDCAQ